MSRTGTLGCADIQAPEPAPCGTFRPFPGKLQPAHMPATPKQRAAPPAFQANCGGGGSSSSSQLGAQRHTRRRKDALPCVRKQAARRDSWSLSGPPAGWTQHDEHGIKSSPGACSDGCMIGRLLSSTCMRGTPSEAAQQLQVLPATPAQWHAPDARHGPAHASQRSAAVQSWRPRTGACMSA